MQELLHRITRLRWAVGYLGEKEQARWWDTSFINDTGRYYLELVYPRTPVSAALHSVSLAAQRVHDDRIGTGRVYHLFRLPLSWEERLQEVAKDPAALEPLRWFSDAAEASDWLASMGSDEEPTTPPLGPIQLPGVFAISAAAVRAMATTYSAAFRGGSEAYPYFRLAP